MNKIILCGNLTKDPELKYTPQGTPVCNFGIAVNRFTKNQATGEREVDFFNCIAWQQRAETAAQYLQKGKKVLVEGRMQMREYTTQQGENRKVWEVTVENLELISPPPSQQQSQPAPAPEANGFDDPFGEE